MKFFRFAVLLLVLFAVTACIHEVDPEPGALDVTCSQDFEAIADGELVWVLDKDIVSRGPEYTFQATESGSKHILKVKESKSLWNETRKWVLNVTEGCDATEDPVVEDPADDPVVEDPADDPVVEDPAEDPVVEDPAEDPVVEDPAEDPVVEDPAEDPVVETICEPGETKETDPCGVGACAGNVGIFTCSADGMAWEETTVCDPLAGAVELPECKTIGSTLDGDVNCNGEPDDSEVPECAPDPICDAGATEPTEACGVGACAGNVGTMTCTADGMAWEETEACDPMAGAVELPECKEPGSTLEGDINCNGEPDDSEVAVCASTPGAPVISATDRDAGLTDIEISWDAVEGATYYNVYISKKTEDGDYELIAENISETAYTYTENWDEDVIDKVGDTPRLDDFKDAGGIVEGRTALQDALFAYRKAVESYLDVFKAVHYFKVEACNELGCSDQSAVDAGRANYIHTEQFSDIAQLIILMAGNPLLIMATSAPIGADALFWEGMTIEGPQGGNINITLEVSSQVNVKIVYTDYAEGVTEPRMVFNGIIERPQQLNEAMAGVYTVEGDITAVEVGEEGEIQAHLYSKISSDSTDESLREPNVGTIDVTFNGDTYQFPLPI